MNAKDRLVVEQTNLVLYTLVQLFIKAEPLGGADEYVVSLMPSPEFDEETAKEVLKNVRIQVPNPVKLLVDNDKFSFSFEPL